jgi:type I restriction enzyme M protein
VEQLTRELDRGGLDMTRISTLAAVQSELDRVSQTLTCRIRELAERYATPLPKLTEEVETLATRVDEQFV